MQFKKENNEVLVAEDEIVIIERKNIEMLKQLALKNQRKRIRLCSHKNVEDALHEMFIVHTKGAYVVPHKHLNKSESMHVLEGEADILFFDEYGEIKKVVSLGDYNSGKIFYFRIDNSNYHALLIRSEFFVFHEITKGPFNRKETVIAPWAPKIDDQGAVKKFLTKVGRKIT